MLKFFISATILGIVWFIADSLLGFSKDALFILGFFGGAITEKFIVNPMVLKDANRQ